MVFTLKEPGHLKIQLGIRISEINQIFDSIMQILQKITFRQSVASYDFFWPSVFSAKSLFGKVVFGEVSRILFGTHWYNAFCTNVTIGTFWFFVTKCVGIACIWFSIFKYDMHIDNTNSGMGSSIEGVDFSKNVFMGFGGTGNFVCKK